MVFSASFEELDKARVYSGVNMLLAIPHPIKFKNTSDRTDNTKKDE